MTLICVIMAAPTRDIRNASAAALLDYGFAGFSLYTHQAVDLSPIPVVGGVAPSCGLSAEAFTVVLPKGSAARVAPTVSLPTQAAAPIKAGEALGEVLYTLDGKELGRSPIRAAEDVKKIDFWGVLCRILGKMAFCE